MRRCKIPVGCKLEYKPCCADCGDKTCEARCWNKPDRCNCWEDGPPPKKRGRYCTVDKLQIALLRARGLSQGEIARQLGCARSTVHNVLQKMEANGHADP